MFTGRSSTVVKAAVVIVIVALTGVLVWYGGRRLTRLDRQLTDTESRASELYDRLGDYSRELDQALERAKAARKEADEAVRKEQTASAARTEAEQQAESAKTAQQAAEAEKEKANVETAQARQELTEIQQRRARELDRMQEALNRIAPTKRTPAGMIMTLSENALRFEFDKADLRAENREMLSRIAGVLLASEGYRLFVDGHTDDVGTDAYNKGLSARRAATVRDYLVQAGIPSDAITVQGFGKKQPVVDEKSRDARAQNRRVEIGIVDTIIHYDQDTRN